MLKKKDIEKLKEKEKTFDIEVKLNEKDAVLKNLKKKNKEYLEHIQKLEKQLDIKNSSDLKNIKTNKIKSIKINKNKNEATAIWIGSDWHLFEKVDPRSINYVNIYNKDIAENRIMEFFKGALKWTNIHRNGVKIKNLVLPLLGDILNNEIHEDNKRFSHGSVLQEVKFAKKLIKSGIDFILKEGNFDNITFIGVDGNHGRNTEKIRNAGRTLHSYEISMYDDIADFYCGNKRIDFKIATGLHTYLDIYDKVFRFHHGDKVRYNGGVGGITVPLNKKIDKWNKTIKADYDILGHFHQHFWGGNFIVNGSAVGYNAYAAGIAASSEPPIQLFSMIDSKHGLNAVHPIYLEDNVTEDSVKEQFKKYSYYYE